jgi:hypothetical protein
MMSIVLAAVLFFSPAPPPPRAACDPAPRGPRAPSPSFLDADRIVHLRVAGSVFGPEWEGSRCVALDLEVRDVFRGVRDDAVVHAIVRQSMITHYTSRPAGVWWIVEQDLAPASEYVAFCAGGTTLAAALPSSCSILPAALVLPDLTLLRDLDTKHAGAEEVIDAVRARCTTASHLAAGYVWGRFAAASARDLSEFDRILSLLVEPSCTAMARTSLLIAVTAPQDSLPHVRKLVRALFQMLAMFPDQRDNLIETYIPNWLGKHSADEIFAGAAAARREAAAALRAYTAQGGRADVAPLRKWLGK